MGVPFFLKSWEEIGNRAGEKSRTFVEDVGEKILEGGCRIASKYPRSFPMNPYARGFIGGFCADRNYPIPNYTPPTFTGGQCITEYRIIASCSAEHWEFDNDSEAQIYRATNYPSIDTQNYRVVITGKILGLKFIPGSGCPVDQVGRQRCDVGSHTINLEIVTETQTFLLGASTYTQAPFEGAFKSIGGRAYWDKNTLYDQQFEILRVDNFPDNCGNPPDGLPEEPPLERRDFRYNVTINNYNANGDIINENTLSLEFSQVNKPNFEFDVDIGGAKFETNINGFGGGGGGSSQDNENPEEDLEEEEQEELEEDEKIVEGIKYVLIRITKEPNKGKTILHKSAENNTYFAGYFSWLINVEGTNYRMPEQPIRKRKTIFKSPDDATGYAYYTVNNAGLQVTTYVKK